jgi:hypothetical protein
MNGRQVQPPLGAEGGVPIASTITVVACDFLVVVTARFRTLYVFLLMEVGTRRIETHELGEELVGPYRYQVHLLHWLESNVYGVFLSDKRSIYIKAKRMDYLSDRSDFKAGQNYCAAQVWFSSTKRVGRLRTCRSAGSRIPVTAANSPTWVSANS